MNNLISEIRKSHLFFNVSDDDIDSFLKLHPCKIFTYKKNECVITKDEISKNIGVILDGTVGIYSDSNYGDHAMINVVSRDYLFGFIANFYNEGHSITSLYTRDHCRIAYFYISSGLTSLQFIKTTPPQILSNIYEMLTKHIRDDFNHMYFISSDLVAVKLSRYLLYLMKEKGSDSFDIGMNRTELSNYLGVYRTSLSREINKLCKNNIIMCKRNFVKILEPQTLLDIELSSQS